MDTNKVKDTAMFLHHGTWKIHEQEVHEYMIHENLEIQKYIHENLEIQTYIHENLEIQKYMIHENLEIQNYMIHHKTYTSQDTVFNTGGSDFLYESHLAFYH